jgi:hypothetical protein
MPFGSPIAAEVQLDLGAARLRLDEHGRVTALTLADGSQWPVDDRPVFSLETEKGTRVPESVELAGEKLTIRFQGGAIAEFAVKTTPTAAARRRPGRSVQASVARHERRDGRRESPAVAGRTASH